MNIKNRLSPKKYLELNRAFAEAYLRLKDEPELRAFSRKVTEYQRQLVAYGLKVCRSV